MNAANHDTPAYWEALGQFVQQFARTEYALTWLLWHLPNDNMELGRAIFVGKRADELIKLVRPLYKFHKFPKETGDNLEDAIQRFKKISLVRNNLMHYGISFHGSDPVSSNRHNVPIESTNIHEYAVSIEILGDMRSDLERIAAVFFISRDGHQKFKQFYLDRFGRHLQNAWRGKLP